MAGRSDLRGPMPPPGGGCRGQWTQQLGRRVQGAVGKARWHSPAADALLSRDSWRCWCCSITCLQGNGQRHAQRPRGHSALCLPPSLRTATHQLSPLNWRGHGRVGFLNGGGARANSCPGRLSATWIHSPRVPGFSLGCVGSPRPAWSQGTWPYCAGETHVRDQVFSLAEPSTAPPGSH